MFSNFKTSTMGMNLWDLIDAAISYLTNLYQVEVPVLSLTVSSTSLKRNLFS